MVVASSQQIRTFNHLTRIADAHLHRNNSAPRRKDFVIENSSVGSTANPHLLVFVEFYSFFIFHAELTHALAHSSTMRRFGLMLGSLDDLDNLYPPLSPKFLGSR